MTTVLSANRDDAESSRATLWALLCVRAELCHAAHHSHRHDLGGSDLHSASRQRYHVARAAGGRFLLVLAVTTFAFAGMFTVYPFVAAELLASGATTNLIATLLVTIGLAVWWWPALQGLNRLTGLRYIFP